MTSPHALSPGIMSSQVPGLVTKKTPSAALIEVVDPSEDVKPEGCTKSLAEIKSLLGVLINHAEAVPESERQPAVQNWTSKFAKSPQSLEAIVALYPFLVEEHPLHPALAYQKMKAWEDHLFSKLGNPADVAKMRKSKSVEIRKSKPEDVPREPFPPFTDFPLPPLNSFRFHQSSQQRRSPLARKPRRRLQNSSLRSPKHRRCHPCWRTSERGARRLRRGDSRS